MSAQRLSRSGHDPVSKLSAIGTTQVGDVSWLVFFLLLIPAELLSQLSMPTRMAIPMTFHERVSSFARKNRSPADIAGPILDVPFDFLDERIPRP